MVFTIATVFEIHQPYLWSIDAGFGCEISDQDPSVPARVIYYSVSGDGNYVATLSTKDKHIQLDMWGLEMDSSAGDIESRAPFAPSPCGRYKTSISDSVDSDMCM